MKKKTSEYNILGESLLEENNACNSELDSPPTTSVSKPSNLDEERMIKMLKMKDVEYTEKIILGEMIQKVEISTK